MLDRNVDLRVEAASLAAECKQLRIEHRRYRDRARKQKGFQLHGRSELTAMKREGIYIERMEARRASRLHHLSRMLLKGIPYLTVENKTYEKVNAEELTDVLSQWEPSVTVRHVADWLGYA